MMHWSTSLLSYFFRVRVLKKRIPLLASFKVTHACNLSCLQCPFHLRAGGEGSSLDRRTALDSLEKLKNLGVRIVVFEGGEPLLWRDGDYTFHDLARDAGKYFLRVAATTNGTLPLDAPVDTLWVSVDGLKEAHDELRSGSFDRVMENLKKSRHPRLLVHTTLNRKNFRDLTGLAELLRKDAPNVKGMTVQFFYPYHDGEAPLALSTDERAEAIHSVIRLKEKGFPILNSVSRLRAMADNNWTCHDWMLANVDPDGRVSTGCYVRGRGEVRCSDCGFTPVAEASGAFDLQPGSILSGWRTMVRR